MIKPGSFWGTTICVLLLLLLAAAGGLYVYRDSLCDRFQPGWQEAHLFYLHRLWNPSLPAPSSIELYEMRVALAGSRQEVTRMNQEMANERARLMAEQERLRKQSGQPEQNSPWPNEKSNVRTVKQFPYGTATEQK